MRTSLILDPGLGRNNYTFKLFKFPGGEAHIKIDPVSIPPSEVVIEHRLNTSHALMELLLAADACRRMWPGVRLDARIPYLPYARQDRLMDDGEPFSLKVFCDVIRTAGFSSIHTLDPHSDVAAALLDPLLRVIWPVWLLKVKREMALTRPDREQGLVFVAPDGGSLKKIHRQAKIMGFEGKIITAEKHRNTKDGSITHTSVHAEPADCLQGAPCLILDDICDGGRTFIELAKVLRAKGASEVYLAVSHGIFSKGEEELASVIDKIYTTNSINDNESDLIKRFKC